MRNWCLLLWFVTALSWAECKTVNFGLVDWTDLRATTAVASELLQELGYRPRQNEMEVATIYEQLAAGKLDAYLGLWLPSGQAQVDPYIAKRQVELLAKNIPQARYSIAVPEYVYQAGVRSIDDIGQHRQQFAGRLHGLEQGNSANKYLRGLIDSNQHQLGGFNLIELPESLMLRQVNRYHKDQQWVAFLAWEPHPMNEMYQVKYLSGAEDHFGPNTGLSSVHTMVRAGYSQECANVTNLLRQIQIPAEQVAGIMDMIVNQFVPAERAARQWMFTHPHLVTAWLDGVTREDGTPIDMDALIASMELRIGN
ncbi:glycine betaine ABC transporter substrate-binding protein [Bacterioplanes sanyensis]|nr:glycine betaine ABC transporter substrate-binding protein [Bacterioplanes sanyensis]